MPSQIDPIKPVDGAPAVKADLRASLPSARNESESLRAAKTRFGLRDQQPIRAQLEDRPKTSSGVNSGSLALDLETGDLFGVLLTEDVSSSNLPIVPVPGRARAATVILRQGATGWRTLAWRGSSKWAGGTPPAVAAHVDAFEIPAILPGYGRTTWSGFPGEQAFS